MKKFLAFPVPRPTLFYVIQSHSCARRSYYQEATMNIYNVSAEAICLTNGNDIISLYT